MKVQYSPLGYLPLVDNKDCHEAVRQHSQAAAAVVKEQGGQNDLVQRIQKDSYFASVHADLGHLLDPKTFVGRAPQQVEKFICEEVNPVLKPFRELLSTTAELNL